MKTKHLLLTLALAILYSTAQAQVPTSYGNLNQGNAGNGGDETNSYFGFQAGLNNTAVSNTFIGYESGRDNTDGSENTFVGRRAGFNNITGQDNTFIGRFSGGNNIGGDANTIVGSLSGHSNTGSNNTFMGFESGYHNQADGNTAIGYSALHDNTTGAQNTAIGESALFNNTTGEANTAIGNDALAANTTGGLNTANGNFTLFNNTTGDNNTAIGNSTLYSNTTGDNNTANGNSALFSNTIGVQNTAIGNSALFFNTTGNNNTAIGTFAMQFNTTGANNTAVGEGAGPNGSFDNTTALGHNATPTASNQVRIGDALVTSIGGYAPWTILSDGRFKKEVKEDIPGLEFITQLRPVSYDLDRTKIRSFLGKDTKEETPKASNTPYPRAVGFIAQEVAQVLHENSYIRIGIETPQNEKDHYSIRYAEFVVPLVKGMQEQQQLIEVLQQQNKVLQQRIEALENANTDKTNSNLQSKTTDNAIEGFVLNQNIPNPFDKTTTIKAVVPQEVQQAKIVVYNLNGLELESYAVATRGNISVEISGSRFPSGMYLYALVADGRVIDTKKMLLTK